MDNNFTIWIISYLPILTFIFRFVLGVFALVTMVKIIQVANKYLDKK